MLDIDFKFLDNIKNNKIQNINEEVSNYYKTRSLPNFRFRGEANISPPYKPALIKYKNKSFFGVQKPIQTENDEIGQNQAILNSFSNYTDYGNFMVQKQSLGDKLIKKTPISNIYQIDLF